MSHGEYRLAGDAGFVEAADGTPSKIYLARLAAGPVVILDHVASACFRSALTSGPILTTLAATLDVSEDDLDTEAVDEMLAWFVDEGYLDVRPKQD